MTIQPNEDPMFYHHFRSESFDGLLKTIKYVFNNGAHEVHTERWQGHDISKKPEMRCLELLNVDVNVNLRQIESLDHWREDIHPSLPWADNHFAERIDGYPFNPGIEYANWPWAGSAEAQLAKDGGMFNHNYMERYWPKTAGLVAQPTKTGDEYRLSELISPVTGCEVDGPNLGIRHAYGDMGDLVDMLAKEPYTRQAWIPIFFPEDTGVGDGGRKPCTLGYQFILRKDRLHVYYPLRSCDFIRHFRDDIYLTIRLLLWVLDECRRINPDFWLAVKPGGYTMHCTSLHVFANDWQRL